MRKSTKATVARRVDEVVQLLIAGARNADIFQFAEKQGWNVGERQVRRYIKEARKNLADLVDCQLREFMGLQFAQRQALFARTYKEGQYAICLAILKDDAKLKGLYPNPRSPMQVPVMISEQTPGTDLELRFLRPEEREALIKQFEKCKWDELREIRQELLGRPDLLDQFRKAAMKEDEELQKRELGYAPTID
jgi:hypothetical protein